MLVGQFHLAGRFVKNSWNAWNMLADVRCNLIKQCGFHDNLATHYIFLLSFFKYIDSQVHCRDRSRFFFVGGAPPRMCNVNKF